MRILMFYALICLFGSHAQAFVQELYSESLLVKEAGVLSDSFVRIRIQNETTPDLYFGVRMQLQDVGATKKYYENRLIPFLGFQKSLIENLTLIGEVRGYEERQVFGDEKKSFQFESRLGLVYGQIWLWANPTSPRPFSEVYGESFWVPRLDRTPMTTVWFKQGYRFNISPGWMLDPFIEARSQLLQQTLSAGGRAVFQSRSWLASFAVYQIFEKQNSESRILFQIGGVL